MRLDGELHDRVREEAADRVTDRVEDLVHARGCGLQRAWRARGRAADSSVTGTPRWTGARNRRPGAWPGDGRDVRVRRRRSTASAVARRPLRVAGTAGRGVDSSVQAAAAHGGADAREDQPAQPDRDPDRDRRQHAGGVVRVRHDVPDAGPAGGRGGHRRHREQRQHDDPEDRDRDDADAAAGRCRSSPAATRRGPGAARCTSRRTPSAAAASPRSQATSDGGDHPRHVAQHAQRRAASRGRPAASARGRSASYSGCQASDAHGDDRQQREQPDDGDAQRPRRAVEVRAGRQPLVRRRLQRDPDQLSLRPGARPAGRRRAGRAAASTRRR